MRVDSMTTLSPIRPYGVAMIALDLIVCLLITAGFAVYRRFGRSDYERVLRYTEHRLKNDGDADDTSPIAQWHDLAANAHNALVDLTIAIERTIILSGMIAFLAAIIATCDLTGGVIAWLATIILLLLGTIAWQLAKYVPLFTEAKAMLAEFAVPTALLEDFTRWDHTHDSNRRRRRNASEPTLHADAGNRDYAAGQEPFDGNDAMSSPFAADVGSDTEDAGNDGDNGDANDFIDVSSKPLSRRRLAARRTLTHSRLRWRDRPVATRATAVFWMLACVFLTGLCALCLAAGFMFGVDHGWQELRPVERGWQMMTLGVGFGFTAWLVWWRIGALLSDMPRLRLRWQTDWRFDGLRLGVVSRRLAYVPSPLDRTLHLSPDDANRLALDDPLRGLTFGVSPLGLLSQVNGDPVLLNTRVHVAEEHWMQSSRMMFAAVTDSFMLMWEPFALTVSEPGLEPRVTLRPDRCWVIPHGIMRRENGDAFVIEGAQSHRPFRIRMRIEPEE
ncbi:hypothetical protein BBIA_1630 [Bifidobacterium biavatii DSM 23969]|uniref:Uncharacterized protein n=3 Tax=Bifidobacterium biavatii TaxID=762212 RepID=A0A086ZYK4_9BIFI|nr:hypothetical protein BBIA_1630 [Bifidobacterium biavatii DSM 23969]